MLHLDQPRDRDVHTIADFAEILCLISPDKTVSMDYLRDFINDNAGDRVFQLSDDALNDVLGQLRWRRHAFGVWYPFGLEQNDQILVAPDGLNEGQLLYASMLFCGNLPFLDRDQRQHLTDFFERVSEVVLRELWSANGVVIAFGKNIAVFDGTKAERLNKLGRLIGGNPRLTDADFRPGDQGDGGIDLAAYVTLDDFEHQNTMAALAQCACSRSDWSRKWGEIGNDRLGHLLVQTTNWQQILFTPICFRSNAGRWAVQYSVPRVTFLDRLRLIESIARVNFANVPDRPPVLQQLLEFRLDIV